MAAKDTKVKGRTAILKAKRECGLEMSRLESAYLALREREALGNAVAGDKIRKLGVEVANNIPFILLLCNIIGLVVILVAVWIPQGEMPYRPLTLLAPLIFGVVTTAFHVVNKSSPSIIYGSIGSNIAILTLIGLATKYPQKDCPCKKTK
tara:strand:- start:584 stop:1033 length:450 start_codon:yes stop_codon:yes gene_type:complete